MLASRLLPLTLTALVAFTEALGAQDPTRPPAPDLEAAPPGDHFDAVLLPSGDTLRYSLYVPPEVLEGGRVPLVLALHPGGMAAPWIGGAYMHQLVRPAFLETGAVIVAPDALTVPEEPFRAESFTSARNLEAVLWLLRRLGEEYPIDPERVVVTGYSRGGQGVWHFAEHHPDLFSAAILVSSRPTEEGVERVDIPVYMIHSIDDEVIGVFLVQGAYQQMMARGAPVRVQILRGPTHYQVGDFTDALAGTIPWLEEVWGGRGDPSPGRQPVDLLEPVLHHHQLRRARAAPDPPHHEEASVGGDGVAEADVGTRLELSGEERRGLAHHQLRLPVEGEG